MQQTLLLEQLLVWDRELTLVGGSKIQLNAIKKNKHEKKKSKSNKRWKSNKQFPLQRQFEMGTTLRCQCSVLLFLLLSISHFVSLSCCLAWHVFYNTFNLVSAL